MRSYQSKRLAALAGTIGAPYSSRLLRVALSVEDVRRFSTLKLINGSMKPISYLFEDLERSSGTKKDTAETMDKLREVFYRMVQTLKIADVDHYVGPVDRLLTDLQQGLKENTSAYATPKGTRGRQVGRHFRWCSNRIDKLQKKTSSAVPDHSYADPGRSNPMRFLLTYQEPYFTVRGEVLKVFSDVFLRLEKAATAAGFRYNYRRKLKAFANKLARARTKLMRKEKR